MLFSQPKIAPEGVQCQDKGYIWEQLWELSLLIISFQKAFPQGNDRLLDKVSQAWIKQSNFESVDAGAMIDRTEGKQ